jgi:hypothetical protein
MNRDRKTLVFVTLSVFAIFAAWFIFSARGTILNLSFPTNVTAGETLFAGKTNGASKICIYNPYGDCGNWCSITEKHILLETKRLDRNEVVRLFYDRIAYETDPKAGKPTFFYFESSCKEKHNSEPFRLYVKSAKVRPNVNEVLIGLE